MAETERERGGEQLERSSEPHAVCRRGAIDNTSAKQLLTSAINLEIPGGKSSEGGATPAHAPVILPIIVARWGTVLGACEGRVGTSAAMHGAGIWDYETMLGVGE